LNIVVLTYGVVKLARFGWLVWFGLVSFLLGFSRHGVAMARQAQ
jgi:hypothetical protein